MDLERIDTIIIDVEGFNQIENKEIYFEGLLKRSFINLVNDLKNEYSNRNDVIIDVKENVKKRIYYTVNGVVGVFVNRIDVYSC